MKKLISFLLVLSMITSMFVTVTAEATEQSDTSLYTYTVSNGEATITDVDTSISGDVTIPSTLGGYPVTSIDDEAFSDCAAITNITIPDSVTSIGSNAFYGCSSLTSIEIPDSVTSIDNKAFRDCSSLTSIVIPDSVTSIAYGAFLGCSGLTSITVESGNTKYYSDRNCLIETDSKTLILGCQNSIIPTDGSVTSIGFGAFYGCSSLTSVTIPDSVTGIGLSAFYGCSSLEYNEYENGYYLGNENNPYVVLIKTKSTDITAFNIHTDTKIIYDSAFYNCSSLTSIEIPNSVTSIGYGAFACCSSLTSIEIPDGVTSIGVCAFAVCSSLTSVVIPDSVTSIDMLTFFSCNSLASVEIPDGVTNIGYAAFQSCSSLASVEIPDGVTSIGYAAFQGCNSLTSIIIPDSVTNIDNQAFICDNLTSVTIGNSVTSIGGDAFAYCSNLTSVYITDIDAWFNIDFENSGSNPLNNGANLYFDNTLVTDLVIPDSVTNIGEYAFYGCSSLTSIVIPDSVTSIGVGAFEGCSSLMSVAIPDSVTSIGSSAFSGCSSLTSITIPDSVTSIDGYAFYNCTNLTSINIPDSVTNIGDSAFDGCSSLEYNEYENGYYLGNENNPYVVLIETKSTDITAFNIHTDTKIIYGSAFSDCRSLSSIVIPDSVTSIGDSAFYACFNLTSIVIPDSVTSIDRWAFYYCSNLEYNEYENGYYLGNENNPYVVLIETKSTDITEFNIHTDTKIIYGSAFSDCSSLTSVAIPDSVTSIGSYAFYHCSGLTSIVIPDGVTSIDYDTFSGCSSLKNVTIPVSVKFFAPWAFAGCDALTTVYYGGNQNDWDKISIGSVNEDLTNANIIFKAPDDPQLIMSSTETLAGKEITLTLLIENNPGISGLVVSLKYDENVLTLKGTEGGDLFSGFTAAKNFLWDESFDVTEDGILATFTFEVAEDAEAGDYSIEIIVRDCVNVNFADVELTGVSGKVSVSVIDCIYGDANGDGIINAKDTTLIKKYLASYDPDSGTSDEVVKNGADVNGDGIIDAKDATKIKKYVANYDPETGTSSEKLGPQ